MEVLVFCLAEGDMEKNCDVLKNFIVNESFIWREKEESSVEFILVENGDNCGTRRNWQNSFRILFGSSPMETNQNHLDWLCL